MNSEMKPEEVMKALTWYEVICENIGSVTVPSNELKAIATLLREKDAEIERLSGAVKKYEEDRKYHFKMSRTRIAEAKADTVRKMRHKIWLEFSYCTEEEMVSVGSFRASVDQIAKEMLEGE